MIKGLFETHLFVESLERSTNFYKNVLGLQLDEYVEERKVAFFWLGHRGNAMLGIWEKPKNEIEKRHFAFRCDADDILNRSVEYLNDRKIDCYNFLKDGSKRPMVFCWMPAISIYFNDPDGHYLEFIAMLPEAPRPDLGVVSYDEWMQLNNEA